MVYDEREFEVSEALVDHGPSELRAALERATAGHTEAELGARVARLIDRYRSGGAATAPILSGESDVLAYAAYRMPATYAACRLSFLAARAAGLAEVNSVVDLGGGTGAACWAAAQVWTGVRAQLREQVPEALALAARLDPGLDTARWHLGEPVPTGDLVCVSYVLSELSQAQQRAIIDAAAQAAGRAVAVVEPGTPDGYRRVLAAREGLIEAGWTVLAPCPQDGPCPLQDSDWCHFAARVDRSGLHRRLKGGDLGHEDEKFCYLLAAAPGTTRDASVDGATAARIIRHPVKRKGLVELQLCRPDGTAGRQLVSKRDRAAYRQARDVRWGEEWPPVDR